jgi:hypothetical protein
VIHRRTFFKAGIGGALILGGAYSVQKSLDFNKHPDYQFFDKEDVQNMRALSKAILNGTPLVEEEVEDVVKGVEIAILGLTPMVQKEIKELLLLFKWKPTKWVLGFNPKDIEGTSTLLSNWRVHRTQTLRAAYGAISELVNASYYARPKTWEAIGYPGPMELDT